MYKRHQETLFDELSENYDTLVQQSADMFPFGGYDNVLDEIVKRAAARPDMNVLDLGTGTGNVAARFVELQCNVWGVDFSSGMLAKARKKLPQVTFVQAELLEEWPCEISKTYDRIVSAYALHHFNLTTKIRFLQRLVQHYLTDDGFIIVGDIAFPTVQEREKAKTTWKDDWDEDEYYWAANETITACQQAHLAVEYTQISSYGGVFIINPA